MHRDDHPHCIHTYVLKHPGQRIQREVYSLGCRRPGQGPFGHELRVKLDMRFGKGERDLHAYCWDGCAAIVTVKHKREAN